MAYALAHKGKAMTDVAYNPEDPPSAYSNETVHSHLDGYTSMAKVVHGPEYDLSAHDLDGEVVMRAGRGKNNEPDPGTILTGKYRTLILTFYEINYA